MTLLIHKSGLWTLIGLAVAATLGIGIGAYAVPAESAGDGGVAAGERLLFAAIVCASLLVVIGTVVHARSVSVSRTLAKLTEMSRSTGASPEPGLKRLGELGARISRLYSQQIELGAHKSDKIGALSSLCDHILTIAAYPIAVTDPAGTVLYRSPPLLQELGLSQQEVLGATLDSLVPDTNLVDAARHFERDRTPLSLRPNGRLLTVLPIYSRSGKLSYCVCVFGDIELSASTASAKQRRKT